MPNPYSLTLHIYRLREVWGWIRYASIVDSGYSYQADGEQHNIAFFPLFPILVGMVRSAVRMPTAVAAVVVNNAAFLAMLFVVFIWIRDRSDVRAARWTVATLCCAPMSIFGSTAYSEGTFMLLTSIGLRSLENKKFGLAAFVGLLTSLVRAPGIALALAYFAGAIKTRGPQSAWLAALAPGLGLCMFSLYCKWHFDDWLAFVHAQSAWRQNLGFNLSAWGHLFGAGIASKPILHLFAIVAGLALWFLRHRLPVVVSAFVAVLALEAERWAWNGSEYVMLFTIGSASAAVVFRNDLGRGALTFLLSGIAMIALSGTPVSVDRFGYALVPGIFALALIWRRFPAIGVAAIVVMFADLILFALRFSRGIFVS